MQALILAAGLGTRLKPLTDTKPKALIEVNGVPLIERLILKLASEGFNHIVINIHHFSDQIIDFIRGKNNFGLNILFSDETDLLRDTGGAIKLALENRLLTEPFLIHNVDIISDLNIKEFYDSFTKSRKTDPLHIASLLVKQRETKRYLLLDDRMVLRGWKNISTGEIKPASLSENEVQSLRQLAFSGIHIVSPDIKNYMVDWPERFSIIDLYLSMIGKATISGYCQDNMEIIDVGKVETLEKLENRQGL